MIAINQTLRQFMAEAKTIEFDLGEEVEFEDSFKVDVGGGKLVNINPKTELEVVSTTDSQIGFRFKGLKKKNEFYLTRAEIKSYGGRLV